MKNISKYTFLLLILLVSSLQQGKSQEKQAGRIKGPRFGVDVSGLVWRYVDTARKNIGVTADMEIKSGFYAVVEAGRLKTDRKLETHHYVSDGYYGKIGFDYNFLEPQPQSNYDMLYGGFRTGYSRFTHLARDIKVLDGYWGNFTGSFQERSMNAIWVEAVVGVKTEVLKNLFFGWSVRGQLMLRQKGDTRMKAWLVPGYGKATKNTTIYVTYTLSYRLPLYRVNDQ